MSTRYYLEDLLPERDDIWYTEPNSTADDREYDRDIRARPKYANDIGAAAILNIHTNGGPTAARGTRVYHSTGRVFDQALGNSILCYMREIITAQDGYEDFIVGDASIASLDYGENTIAEIPAVLVEVAFHSNPDDAAALLDPPFRTAAMKGVEKGYRLHGEGKPCTDFEITDIPDIGNRPTPPGVYAALVAFFEGYPQSPATAEVEILSCPSTVICEGGMYPVLVEFSPAFIPFRCGGAPTEPEVISFRTRLIDADNVKTEWDESNFTCIPPVDA
jgi:hypothetical protein